MSVLIKGMEMPYCCVVCPFKEMYNDGLLCKATNPHQYIPKFLHKRNERCPLVEVPTPHGDLIDKYMILKELQKLCKNCSRGICPDYCPNLQVKKDIRSAKIVLEAEADE